MSDTAHYDESYRYSPSRTIHTELGNLISIDASVTPGGNADVVIPLENGEMRVVLSDFHALHVSVPHDRESLRMDLKYINGVFQSGIFQCYEYIDFEKVTTPLGFAVMDGKMQPYIDSNLPRSQQKSLAGLCEFDGTEVRYDFYDVRGSLKNNTTELLIQGRKVHIVPELAGEEARELERLLLDGIDIHAEEIISLSRQLAGALALPETRMYQVNSDGDILDRYPEVPIRPIERSVVVGSEDSLEVHDVVKNILLFRAQFDEDMVSVEGVVSQLNNTTVKAELEDQTIESVSIMRKVNVSENKNASVGFRKDELGLLFPYIRYVDAKGIPIPIQPESGHTSAQTQDEIGELMMTDEAFLFESQDDFIFTSERGVYTIIQASDREVVLQISEIGPVLNVSDGNTTVDINVHPVIDELPIMRRFLQEKKTVITKDIQKTVNFICSFLGV